MMRRMMFLLALPLAACQAQDDTVEQDVQIDDNGVPAGEDAIVTDSETQEAATSQAHTDAEMAQPMGKGFPTSFQGRWGLVANDCTSTKGDAKGLLKVAGDQLRFYESVGTVKEISIVTPEKVDVKLAFEGEGQKWEKSASYSVADGGRTLVRKDADSDQAYRYRRCD